MMSDARTTGWKIPLIFCAVVLGVVAITALLRWERVDAPPLPDALLAQAQAIVIQLDNDEEGRKWKADISAVAGGFTTRAEKDQRIMALVRLTLEHKRYDAACTAAVLMYNNHQRDAAFQEIGDVALQECATLPWGVMAAKGMHFPKAQAEMQTLLIQRWQECAVTP